MHDHTYSADLSWTGSTGAGYRAYPREHSVTVGTDLPLAMSADATFRGDPALPNPEQLIVAAAGSCQLLSFLAVAARAGIDVVRYRDVATGLMPADVTPVRITEISLRPTITVRGGDVGAVRELVEQAHEECYIANSLTTTITVEASIEIV